MKVTSPRQSLRATRYTRLVASIVVLVGVMSFIPTSATATFSATAPRLSAVVHDGRFIRGFSLDLGEMSVRPAPNSLSPVTSESVAASKIWATTAIQSTERRFIGFGVATIRLKSHGVPVVKKLPAWIGVTYSQDSTVCPLETGPFKKLTPPPTHGYTAVILGDEPGSPAVVYSAATDVCDKYVPASVDDALDEWSASWTLVRLGVIAVHYPFCAKLYGTGSGYSPQSGLTINEDLTLAEDPEEMPKGYCQPARVVIDNSSEVVGASSTTHHPPAGLESVTTS